MIMPYRIQARAPGGWWTPVADLATRALAEAACRHFQTAAGDAELRVIDRRSRHKALLHLSPVPTRKTEVYL